MCPGGSCTTSGSAGRALAIKVERNGAQLVLKATPTLKEVKDNFGNVHRIGILVTPGDDIAIENAREIADRFDAVLSRDERQVDLLIVPFVPRSAVVRWQVAAD